MDIGGVREPLPQIIKQDTEMIDRCVTAIEEALSRYCRED